MRNLKKVLALVLAVVMIFGVMSLTSATFTDDANVTNTEAVEVMAGLKILEGYTDGSYKPEGNVTREEMATIICKMLLGPDVAKTLAQGTSNFKDVEATRWSAGYIEYCANLGIIDGYGDGTFKPTGNVTIGEAAKMLLVAAGIKGTYTGADWLVNVTAAATKAGILPTSVDVRATATRDQVALYAFNALNYSAGTTTYIYNVYNTNGTDDNTADDTLLATYKDAASAYFYAQSTTAGVKGKYVAVLAVKEDTLGYKVFKLMKEGTFDLYGRPATRWFTDNNSNRAYDVKTVTYPTTLADEQLYFYVVPATETYTTPIAAPTFAEMVAAYQAQGYTVKYGAKTVVYSNANADADAIAAATVAADTGYSELTEIYVDAASRTVTIVITPEHVAVVTAVVPHAATALKGAYTEYKLSDSNSIVIYSSHVKAGIEADTGTMTGTATVGSVVTYTNVIDETPEPDKVVWIDAQVITSTISGVITSYDAAAQTWTINGTVYHIADCLMKDETIMGSVLYGQTGTFYFDQYGNIAYADFGKAVSYAQVNYLQVYDAKTYVNGLYFEHAMKAQLVFEDGTTKIVDVAAINENPAGLPVTENIKNAEAIAALVKEGSTYKEIEHNVVTYTVDETTGAYTLFTYKGATEDNLEETEAIQPYQYFVKNGAAVTNYDTTYLANTQTTFIVRTGANAATYKWTVYTGYATLPALSDTEHTCVTAIDKNRDGYVDLVYIISKSATVATDEYVYITGAGAKYELLGNGTYVTSYPAADGTYVTSAISLEKGLYHVTERDSTGAVTAATQITDFKTSDGYSEVNGLKTSAYTCAVTANSKLVLVRDGVVVDGATWADVEVSSTNPGEYKVEVYVVADKTNALAVGTAYVIATLNPQP